MKVGVVTRTFPPAEGGVENYLLALMEGLKERCAFRTVTQVRESVKPYPGQDDIFAPPPLDYEYRGFKVRSLGPTPLDRLKLSPCLLRLVPGLRRYFYTGLRGLAVRRFAALFGPRVRDYLKGVEIVHSFAFGGMGEAAAFAASALQLPFVITPFVHPGRWGDSPRDIDLYRRASSVIALHEQDRRVLAALGVPADRIRIVPVCISPFAGNREAFRTRHGISGPMALFVGRMLPHKGYRELISAVQAINAGKIRISLVLMGPAGPGEASALSSLRKSGIIYAGHASESEKHDAFAACDLFCLPSDSEILPVSILEAWHAGKPVLAGDIPAVRELVEEGRTGMFTRREPAAIRAKLDAFLRDESGWRGMGSAGQKLVELKHLAARSADVQAAVYAEAAASSAGLRSSFP